MGDAEIQKVFMVMMMVKQRDMRKSDGYARCALAWL